MLSQNGLRALVAGAGPAGAIAALELARAGADVMLVEKKPWPREKTCGDAISPLGIAEGRECGIAIEGPLRLTEAIVSVPSGVSFRGGWPSDAPWGTTIRRREFDAQLVDAAIVAGARFEPGTAIERLHDSASDVEAVLRTRAAAPQRERFDLVVVADGAAGTLASSLGFPPIRSRLVALRGYSDLPRPLTSEYGLFFERGLSPGYGWIFPMDERVANVGVLVDDRTIARSKQHLRELLSSWLRRSKFVSERIGSDSSIDASGGIIPSGRSIRARGRVFLAGDAAGVADPFTAEGIFQAMRSGRAAARAIARSRDLATARSTYERDLRIFDRNDRVARAMRATFNVAIEPYARHAAGNERYARHLNTEVFFLKRSFVGFVWGLTRAW